MPIGGGVNVGRQRPFNPNLRATGFEEDFDPNAGLLGPGGGQPPTLIGPTGQLGGGQAPTGGGGPGVPGAGDIPGNLDFPQLPYQPGAPDLQGPLEGLEEAGLGLLDPESDYSKRLLEELQRQIGGQTEARKRASTLTAAQSGLGGGASPELLSIMRDLDVSGLEAMGGASADLRLASPRLGGQLLGPAIRGRLGLQGQALSGFMGQQQLQQQQQTARLQAQLEQRRLDNDLYLRELGLLF